MKVPRRFRTIEIPKCLGNWPRERSMRVLCAKNVSASAMSRQHVAKLCNSLQSGRCDVKSCNMTGISRTSSSTTEINKARIGEMIQNDRWVTLREISSELGAMVGCSISFLIGCDIQRQYRDVIHRDLAQRART
ncbi:hypothetical protein TNCV_400691 [Trichonephila clavipes]|nr:hypothetical protein TNCV_400691 [Trichonephila clavipes]